MGAGADCTMSRCCDGDASLGCFLNRTQFRATGVWRAFCEASAASKATAYKDNRLQLHNVAEGEALLDMESDGNVTSEKYFYTMVTSKHAFCESSALDKCLGTWRADADQLLEYLDNKAADAIEAVGLSPKVVVLIVVASTLLGLCALACAVLYRRSLKRRLHLLEQELSDLRNSKREVAERRRGGEDTAALVGEEAAVQDGEGEHASSAASCTPPPAQSQP